MGSANGNKPLLPNELRLIGDKTVVNAEAGSGSASNTPTPIEKLVQRLRFENPQAAIAYLQSNPGILGQTRLLNALNDHLQ